MNTGLLRYWLFVFSVRSNDNSNEPNICFSVRFPGLKIYGEVSEWFKELVLKTSDPFGDQEFESLPLRQNSLLRGCYAMKQAVFFRTFVVFLLM